MFFREAEELDYTGDLVDDDTASCGKCVRLDTTGDEIDGSTFEAAGGVYNVFVAMKMSNIASSSKIVDVLIKCKDGGDNPQQLMSKEVHPSDFPTADKWYVVMIPDVRIMEDDYDLEVEVTNFVDGIGDLYVDYIACLSVGLAGSWRQEHQGTLYSNLGFDVTVGNTFSNICYLPKDCFVVGFIDIELNSAYQAAQVYADITLYDSELDAVQCAGHSHHDWEYPNWFVPFVGYTGHPDGGDDPRLNIFLKNQYATTLNFDVRVTWSRSPIVYL
ncbi:hypothetical protein ACFLXE_00145 [Chloroflexota bacterium]